MDALAAAYGHCRQVHRRHGRSYYLATRLLPAWKRRHVHALYGFTRYADDIVDGTGAFPVTERARRLEAWSTAFLGGLDTAPVDGDARLLAAVRHTVRVFDLDLGDFRTFLDSMAMDLTVTSYQTYPDLLGYMAGSAAAIGTMMLPILQAGPDGPTVGRERAKRPARELGLAFQLTNFIRDVGEDLDRGRLYLPLADLDRFGVDRADLLAARLAGRSGPAVRALIRFEVTRARGHYAAASAGIGMLRPSSRPCIAAAFRIYGGILDEVEQQGYDVFARRAVVPAGRRLRLLAGALLRPVPGSRDRAI
jgi:phytoene synthase